MEKINGRKRFKMEPLINGQTFLKEVYLSKNCELKEGKEPKLTG